MHILLLNAGSSSLKCVLMNAANGDAIAHGLADWAGDATHYSYQCPSGQSRQLQVNWRGYGAAVRQFISDLASVEPAVLPDRHSLAIVGHRIVHGGEFTESVEITPQVRAQIEQLAELAPLHNPPGLETLSAAQQELPQAKHIAIFDTAFHATLPPQAYTYPIPRQWTADWKIRRYGFHGLSHAYCSRRAAQMLNRPSKDLRIVVCHLGNGCSATAIQGGKSIDTTMGYTPLDGLMMGTRCGSIDPGIITHVQHQFGLTPAQVDAALNRESGLLGVSGISSDMRSVLAAAQAGNQQAQLAIETYAHRVRQAVGALTVTLGGMDALVFTAGVGEHAREIRRLACQNLECLGLKLDPHFNANRSPDCDIAASDSPGRILAITTREDLTMLREIEAVLAQSEHSS